MQSLVPMAASFPLRAVTIRHCPRGRGSNQQGLRRRLALPASIGPHTNLPKVDSGSDRPPVLLSKLSGDRRATQDLVTQAWRADRLRICGRHGIAAGLARGATSAQKPVNRFQRPCIWSVESSESILKLPRGGSDFFARRRKVFDERAGGKRKGVRKL